MRAPALALLPLAAMMAGVVPRPVANFTIETTTGAKLNVRDYRGQVVLLAFILTNCPHCQATTRVLGALQQQFGSRGLRVVEAAVEDDAKSHLPAFQKTYAPPFPLGWSDRPAVVPVLKNDPNKLMMMPQLLLIDRKGIVRAQISGDDKILEGDEAGHLRALIEKYL